MRGRRNTRSLKREEEMPTPKNNSILKEKANSIVADQASTQSQSSPGLSMNSEDIIWAIQELNMPGRIQTVETVSKAAGWKNKMRTFKASIISFTNKF